MKTLNIPNSEVDKKWIAVALKRLAEIESGKVKLIPASAVFERISKCLASIK